MGVVDSALAWGGNQGREGATGASGYLIGNYGDS